MQEFVCDFIEPPFHLTINNWSPFSFKQTSHISSSLPSIFSFSFSFCLTRHFLQIFPAVPSISFLVFLFSLYSLCLKSSSLSFLSPSLFSSDAFVSIQSVSFLFHFSLFVSFLSFFSLVSLLLCLFLISSRSINPFNFTMLSSNWSLCLHAIFYLTFRKLCLSKWNELQHWMDTERMEFIECTCNDRYLTFGQF